MLRKVLLVCGILSSLLYVAANIITVMLYPGYSAFSGTVSELSAIGAPTRSLWVWLMVPYSLLVIAFGWGVWMSAGRDRPLPVVGSLMIAGALLGFAWPPMHQREMLAAGGGSLTDTLHIVWTVVTSILFLLVLGFGAAAFGKWFRLYSIATMVTLVAFGALTGMHASGIEANLPTPWIGVWERINIGAYMLWVAVLGIALLHDKIEGFRKTKKTYLPAAGRDWLLAFYDPFTKLLGVETFHRKLISQANIRPAQRILEIGCGTGNLSILAKRLNPAAEVVGIDPDPKALARARRKAERRGDSVQFDPGFSEKLPYPDASFDSVLSAFMLHHIKPDERPVSLGEVFRVLKPGGSLHLADFDEGQRLSGGFHGFLAGILHSRHASSPHQTVLALMRHAGFADTQEVDRHATVLGRIVYYRAVRPPLAEPSAG